MTNMFDIFLAILPVFLIIGAGMIADRFHFLPESTGNVLSAYVLRLGLPFVLIRIMANAAPEELAQGGYWVALLISQAVVYVVGYAGDLVLARRGQGPAIITALSSSCCNAAFLGLAIIASLFPDNPEAMLAAGIATITPSVIMVTGQVHLEMVRQKQEHAESQGIGAMVFRSLVLNPLLMGLALGIVLCVTGIGLWTPLDRAMGLIGSTCAPCALIALGLGMRARVQIALQAQGHIVIRQTCIIVLKLIIHPLLAWWLLSLLGVSGLWLGVGVLMAGTASAVAVYMMGEYYQTVPEESAFSVVLTNGLNLFTTAGFATIFKALGYF